MSEPTPAKRTPPATQILDMLEDMQKVLTEMQAQQQYLVAGVTVLADVKEVITDAVTVMGESVKAQAKETVVGSEGLARGDKLWQNWGPLGTIVMGIVLCIVVFVGLRQQPYPRYDGLGRSLDAALTQHYNVLPKPVQEAVTRSYADQGLQGPAQRKGPQK